MNESTGETATVLSPADGKLQQYHSGQRADFVSATFVGSEWHPGMSRSANSCSTTDLVYIHRGEFEAEVDGGPVQDRAEGH